ncbi:hypothetical protein L1887_12974 [Cichorium endivia]|nr:hypothetical protein L1887_12974 [Cichorium endivia]
MYDGKEIMEATMNFNERYRIGGSVYKAMIQGQIVAVKKFRDATEELKILQRVCSPAPLGTTQLAIELGCFFKTFPESLAFSLISISVLLKQSFPGLPQSSLDISKIKFNKV